jgi:molybdenum cofactor biosynthesis protein B
MPIDEGLAFRAVRVAILTVSDTRTLADDISGDLLEGLVKASGHDVVARELHVDDLEMIVDTLGGWVADDAVEVILTVGGTGLTGRDVTPEAVRRLCDKEIPGFGELFRWLSFASIGTSTIQSRATAGLADTTLIFALPGSRGAVRDAWEKILSLQLDSRHRPCNFVDLMPRFRE